MLIYEFKCTDCDRLVRHDDDPYLTCTKSRCIKHKHDISNSDPIYTFTTYNERRWEKNE